MEIDTATVWYIGLPFSKQVVSLTSELQQQWQPITTLHSLYSLHKRNDRRKGPLSLSRCHLVKLSNGEEDITHLSIMEKVEISACVINRHVIDPI